MNAGGTQGIELVQQHSMVHTKEHQGRVLDTDPKLMRSENEHRHGENGSNKTTDTLWCTDASSTCAL